MFHFRRSFFLFFPNKTEFVTENISFSENCVIFGDFSAHPKKKEKKDWPAPERTSLKKKKKKKQAKALEEEEEEGKKSSDDFVSFVQKLA